MFWRISSFPELNCLEISQRHKLLRAIPWWTYPRMLLVSLPASAVIAMMLCSWLPQSTLVIAFFVMLGIVMATMFQMQMRNIRLELRSTVAEGFAGERPPFCFACGYDLRSSNAPVCPECGKQLERDATGSPPPFAGESSAHNRQS